MTGIQSGMPVTNEALLTTALEALLEYGSRGESNKREVASAVEMLTGQVLRIRALRMTFRALSLTLP